MIRDLTRGLGIGLLLGGLLLGPPLAAQTPKKSVIRSSRATALVPIADVTINNSVVTAVMPFNPLRIGMLCSSLLPVRWGGPTVDYEIDGTGSGVLSLVFPITKGKNDGVFTPITMDLPIGLSPYPATYPLFGVIKFAGTFAHCSQEIGTP